MTLNDEAPNDRAADASVASEAGAQRILFALQHSSRPRAALKMASALAAATRAELHLLLVLPHTGPFGERVDDPRDVLAAWRCIDECVTICRQTRTWFEETLEETLDLQRLRIRCGRPSAAIALRASELDARLVVLAPGADSLGPLAMRVARACSRPVLLARSSVAGGTVIAATDLRDERYRVVRQASALGAALGARVVAVHNVRCLSNSLGAGPDAGARPVLELPRQMLVELPASLDLIVTTEVDPVGAILEQAQRHRSGVIVVGARSQSGRRSDVSVPLEVIARSRCSVLVTSLEA